MGGQQAGGEEVADHRGPGEHDQRGTQDGRRPSSRPGAGSDGGAGSGRRAGGRPPPPRPSGRPLRPAAARKRHAHSLDDARCRGGDGAREAAGEQRGTFRPAVRPPPRSVPFTWCSPACIRGRHPGLLQLQRQASNVEGVRPRRRSRSRWKAVSPMSTDVSPDTRVPVRVWQEPATRRPEPGRRRRAARRRPPSRRWRPPPSSTSRPSTSTTASSGPSATSTSRSGPTRSPPSSGRRAAARPPSCAASTG